MEIVVNTKTVSSHEKEYKRLEFTSWNPYTTKVFKVGDSLPTDSIFLGNTDIGLLFKIPHPRPRSLPVLDMEISTKVSLYFKPIESTRSKFAVDLEVFLIENIFTSEEEEEWWYKFREFELDFSEGETVNNLVTINIVGK